MKIVVIGAGGRIGRSLLSSIIKNPHHEVAAGVVRAQQNLSESERMSGVFYTDALATIDPKSYDVLIDFSTPDAVASHAELVTKLSKPWVIGVTGLSPSFHDALLQIAKVAPVLYAPNTSPAMAVMMVLAEIAAASSEPECDLEIRDVHRRSKRDAPSGTALALEQALVKGGARKGMQQPIRCLSSRGGDMLGAHDITWYGRGETLTISHAVHDRSVYAHGALRAAEWLVAHNAPGFYSMRDVYDLGFSLEKSMVAV